MVWCLRTGELLCRSEWKRTECKYYRGISLLSMVGKIYAGILVGRFHSVTEGLIDDEQGCSDQGGGV